MAREKSSKEYQSNTEKAAALILSGKSKKRGLARLLPFMGPAFIASVAYMDPGNFATNIQGGAQFGYTLLWVVGATNLMAILIQTLSAKLGIASGKNLAELCRENFPHPVVIGMWVLMEIVAMATDLAEFVGAALGFYLLLGIPLWIAGLITAVLTFLILGLERYGFRPIEAVITAMIGVISVSYLIEMAVVHPDWQQVAYHTFVPQFAGSESVLLAVGILGATIMPHVIFLHSSLTQNRIVVRSPAKLRMLFRFEQADVIIAMVVASAINAAMLMMAASTFYHQGLTTVATLQDAYKTLQPLFGKVSGTFFAISLLASGLSSSSVGTMAGQVIMRGFLHKEIPVWIRRVATMIPSLVVLIIGLDPTHTLVISQVVLSFGLPFAVIPLIIFTSRRDVMKSLVNHKITTVVAYLVVTLIISLDIYLLIQPLLRR